MAQKQKTGAQVRRQCPTCRGETIVERPLQEPPGCYFSYEDLSWQGREALLEQGQMIAPDLVELINCPTCAGHGKITVTLSPAEYRDLRRRRIARGAILLIVGAIPFLFLLGSILAQPEMLCGRPWYGVGFFLLLLVVQKA